MGFREDIARRIEKKRAEVADLEAEVKTARTYLQALEDMYKLAARGTSGLDGEVEASPKFRPGSLISTAFAALKATGRPMHVNDLLAAMGKQADRAGKSTLSGTLSPHVTRGHVFTRPAPNTFGLIEFGPMEPESPEKPNLPGLAPPAGFGKL